jgi:hypothetical protein
MNSSPGLALSSAIASDTSTAKPSRLLLKGAAGALAEQRANWCILEGKSPSTPPTREYQDPGGLRAQGDADIQE